MIKQLKKRKLKKVIAIYLAMMILLETLQPMSIYALTGGPSQPEFESFTPIGTSDMVDLASGDLNYNIPIMDVGGYPLNLAYNSGVTMDQEASWVGLGWDLNVGQISRQLRGLPDDFNGDEMIYENNMKPNVTIGGSANFFYTLFGLKEGPPQKKDLKASVGVGIKYNNYDGLGVSANGGMTYQISDNLSVGMNLESSASEGVSVSPSISFHSKLSSKAIGDVDLGASAGVSYNSRKGVESSTMSFKVTKEAKFTKDFNNNVGFGTSGGSISFIDASYTPTKRVGMVSTNFTFNLNIEGEFWGIEPGVKFSGYRTSQGIKDSEKYKIEKGYGFENTYNAGKSDVLDFNREKDRTFNKNTRSLPITNNTYDIYSIQGQGVSGMFRPYKSQVGYVYDKEVNDDTHGASIGIELGGGGGNHWGFDTDYTRGRSNTSLWSNSNPALGRFKEKKTGNRPDYEKIFFKNIGGSHVDRDLDLLNNRLGAFNPIKLEIEGDKFSRSTSQKYSTDSGKLQDVNKNNIARMNRLARNQTIEKLTKVEAKKYGFNTQFSNFSRNHHTAEIRVTKEGGERYVYGRAAYNITKKEATFDVGSNPKLEKNIAGTSIFNKRDGLVNYSGTDNSSKNSQEGDQYFNRITTPAYAHSYLLTAVLSSDYQDLKGDGPSDDDLGSYTKFEYDNKSADKTHTYKWRIPFKKDLANYDEGLRSSKKDNKGNYIYGEKELLYIKKITTKTHVAIFHLSERKDGFGVADENGGLGVDSKMYKLDSINLFSKPEYLEFKDKATPIKTAHFDYSYDLCKGIDNYYNSEDPIEKGGKLTLKKVFFTYKNSKMGMYTPYKFDYGFNPDYNMKAYDVWGNYKPTNPETGYGTTDALSNAEYPFVDQNKTNADEFASVWLLKSIDLPSGGKMQLNYESDDYSNVQDKEAMQMFKVVGASNNSTITNEDINNSEARKTLGQYIHVKLDHKIDPNIADQSAYFKEKYLKNIIDKDNLLYFRFLLNMVGPATFPKIFDDDKYDYVTGYAKIDTSRVFNTTVINEIQYVSIPLEYTSRGDGFLFSGKDVSPIQKAGWNFGRKYLNRLVYSPYEKEDTKDLESIVKELIDWLPELTKIFESPNKQLQEKGIASQFIANKSWVRLLHPDGNKLGGGSRIKQVKILDQWKIMTNHENDNVYQQEYGQNYTYKSENGKSSGVATYEPLGCKENPFVKPAYDRNKRDLLLGPDTDNYVEEPFGESFFPSPKVTYSRVTVANLHREKNENNEITSKVKKHATGTVVTEFYTSRDFPTITDRTVLSSNHDASTALASLLNLNVRDHITISQGFSIHTNDMDGKMKSQRVYPEGLSGDKFISGVDYNYNIYSTESNLNKGRLKNTIQTIDSYGIISENLVGVDYDVINDFRENKSTTETPGIHYNTAGLPLPFIFIIVPTPVPSYSKHENQIRTAVTTKVIHTSGILLEKVAYDLGAKVETKNLAWDAETGDVLLTETVNEYNDHYFNFNYPAYWNYDGMSQAAKNIGLEWGIENVGGNNTHQFQFKNGSDDAPYKASDYLINGDELWLTGSDPLDKRTKKGMKAWVVKPSENNFKLIDQNGLLITTDIIKADKIKVIRSGHRNMQMASMASITSMRNPLFNYVTNQTKNKLENPTEIDKIVNASAIFYNDVWPSQCECNLPKMVFNSNKVLQFGFDTYAPDPQNPNNLPLPDHEDIVKNSYNPYIYNILGNWRADKSYAYLTGRNFNAGTTGPTPRNSGFFTLFNPFYEIKTESNSTTSIWEVAKGDELKKWTYASEVTKYNPYGQEVENKDALKRYSSALYGYNNRFPVAVASNTKYSELASDSFEDYDFSSCGASSHFDFLGQLKINEVSVSTKQSHTGKRSLKIAPSKKAVLKKQIAPCTTAPVTP